MPHVSHKIVAHRDNENRWVEFCEWCGADDNKLENECNRRYHVDKEVDNLKEQD